MSSLGGIAHKNYIDNHSVDLLLKYNNKNFDKMVFYFQIIFIWILIISIFVK